LAEGLFINSLGFGNGYLFNLFFVVKTNAVQYHSNVKWPHLIWAALLCLRLIATFEFRTD